MKSAEEHVHRSTWTCLAQILAALPVYRSLHTCTVVVLHGFLPHRSTQSYCCVDLWGHMDIHRSAQADTAWNLMSVASQLYMHADTLCKLTHISKR